MEGKTMDPQEGKKKMTHVDFPVGPAKNMIPVDFSVDSGGDMIPIVNSPMLRGGNMDVIAKGKQFLEYYYKADLADLANLYQKNSVMTFDGETIQGKEAILAKLNSLKPCELKVGQIALLPFSGTDLSSGLQGTVCGWLDARPFSQMFVLLPTPEGSFDISGSIFYTGPESSGTALAS